MRNNGWVDAFRYAVNCKSLAHINSLAVTRHQKKGDAGSFISYRLFELLAQGDPTRINFMLENLADDNALRGPILYAAGLARAIDLNLDGAARLLREGAYFASLASQSLFEHDKAFVDVIVPSMIHQANLCEPSDFAAEERPPIFPNMEFWQLPDGAGSGQLVMAACDSDYFIAYAGRFLASLRAVAPNAEALVHIVNPTETALALARQMRASNSQVWFSSEIGPRTATYYACSRLVIASRVLARFRGSLLITDIDTVFPREFQSIIDGCGPHEIVLERNSARLQPSMQVSAAFMYFQYGDAASEFLHHIGAYLEKKFIEPHFWMLDQAALFRGLCLMTARGGRITMIQDIAASGNLAFPDCLVGPHILNETVRKGKRSLGKPTGVVFDPTSFKPTCLFTPL